MIRVAKYNGLSIIQFKNGSIYEILDETEYQFKLKCECGFEQWDDKYYFEELK